MKDIQNIYVLKLFRANQLVFKGIYGSWLARLKISHIIYTICWKGFSIKKSIGIHKEILLINNKHV